VLYLTVNPNGEAEVVHIVLRSNSKTKKLKFEYDFSDLAIKGRSANGNLLTKFQISKIELKEQGISTLSARKIWFDETVSRFNTDGRGTLLGEFKGEDKIVHITSSGNYRLTGFDVSTKVDDDYLILEKWHPEKPVTAIYWDGEKEQFFVKRFVPEDSAKKVSFISEHEKSHLEVVSYDWRPVVELSFDKRTNDRPNEEIELDSFIGIKNVKALGNRLTKFKVKSIDLKEPLPFTLMENEEDSEEETGGSDGQITLF
jgi:topoisomerase-4 subunit A